MSLTLNKGKMKKTQIKINTSAYASSRVELERHREDYNSTQEIIGKRRANLPCALEGSGGLSWNKEAQSAFCFWVSSLTT